MKRAVILLSGGLDSATTLAIAKSRGFECYALSFRYGQQHAAELDAARRVAAALGAVEHKILDIDLRAFGGSALTDDIPVPKDPDLVVGGKHALHLRFKALLVTYLPGRTPVFLPFVLR